MGRLMAGTTSSIGHTDTLDMVKGTPLFSAARAACTSPRRAYMPVSPTGESATGMESFSPNSSMPSSRLDMSFCSTRWRKATCAKSDTLRPSVCSAYAPPSM